MKLINVVWLLSGMFVAVDTFFNDAQILRKIIR